MSDLGPFGPSCFKSYLEPHGPELSYLVFNSNLEVLYYSSNYALSFKIFRTLGVTSLNLITWNCLQMSFLVRMTLSWGIRWTAQVLTTVWEYINCSKLLHISESHYFWLNTRLFKEVKLLRIFFLAETMNCLLLITIIYSFCFILLGAMKTYYAALCRKCHISLQYLIKSHILQNF